MAVQVSGATSPACGTDRTVGETRAPCTTLTELGREGTEIATDYDAPRKTEGLDPEEDSLDELKSTRKDKDSGKVDHDEEEAAESFELPGADLSHELLEVEVKPRQADEFTCMNCFLVQHRSALADSKKMLCRDCV